MISFGKLAFFNLDYILGYWFKVKLQLAKGHLVIFDRYYYDYYLDKIRYRLNVNDKLLDTFKMFIPKPDVTFMLMGDPKTLYDRKKEISVYEIEKQLRIMELHKTKFKNPVIINVDLPIDCVVGSVSNTILDELVKKSKGKKKMNILLSAYACEPNKGSEPGVGWGWALEWAKNHNVWVITRDNNKAVIDEYLKLHCEIDSTRLHFVYVGL